MSILAESGISRSPLISRHFGSSRKNRRPPGLCSQTFTSSAGPSKLAIIAHRGSLGLRHACSPCEQTRLRLLRNQEQIVKTSLQIALATVLVFAGFTSACAADNTPPRGFVALFNGKDLTGWKGLLKEPFDNPARRAKLTREEAAELQKEADQVMRKGWRVEKGMLIFNGHGRSLCTAKDYGDFEMYVDWKIEPARRQRHLSPRLAAGANLGPQSRGRSAPAACTTIRSIPRSRPRSPTSPSASGTPSTSRWSATKSP